MNCDCIISSIIKEVTTMNFFNCVIACINLIFALEIVSEVVAQVKKDYPNAKFIEKTFIAKLIGWISIIIRDLIPIYNIIILVGFLFMRETMIEQGYETLLNRMIRENDF